MPLVALTVGFVAVVCLYPIVRLAEAAFRGADGGWSVRQLGQAISAGGLARSAWHSLTISTAVTVLATAVGSALAWLVARTDVPGRARLRWALLAPFAIPPFVFAMAWLQLFGRVGWINRLAAEGLGVSGPLWDVHGPDGIVFVLVLTLYPLAYATVLGALDRFDPSLEETARVAGAGLGRTLRTVTLPVLRPAVLSAAALVFIAAMSNFGVPAVLGFPEGYSVLTTRIFDLIARSAQPGSLNQAAALALVLGVLALSALVPYQVAVGRLQRQLPHRGAADVPLSLGGARRPLAAMAWGVVVVGGLAPLAAITLGAVTEVLGLAPLPGNLTLAHFQRVLEDATTLRAVRNSLVLALLAASAVSLVGAMVAYLATRTRLPGRRLLDWAATFPYALPGTVVAVAVLFGFLRPVGGLALFDTLWLILVAYLAHYLAYGVRAAGAALALIDPQLEEASRVAGASRAATFWRIVAPLVRPSLFAGFFLVLVPTLRELTISALLWSPGNETIGIVVFNLQSAGEAQAAAAVAVVMLITVLSMNLLARRISRGRIGY